MTIKDNGDGTFTLIPTTWFQNDVWNVCRGCGKRVKGDSTHTCSPQIKPTTEYIEKLWLHVINNIPANDNRPVEWHFACELLKQNNVFTHYCDDNIRAKTKPLSDEEINLLKAEIAAHKKTNELLSQKIIELQEDNKK